MLQPRASWAALIILSASSACVYAGPETGCEGVECPSPDGGVKADGASQTPDASGGGGDDPSTLPPGSLVGGAELVGQWVEATSNLAGLQSECGNMSFLSVNPHDGALIAGVAQHGLWRSEDGGGSWSAMGKGANSDRIDNRPACITYDPEDPMRFWESGLYNGIGAFVTTDGGTTFKALGNATTGDSVSVDFTDPDRQTLLLGGHEVTQGVWLSRDGGTTWTSIGSSMPVGKTCNSTLVIDAQTFLIGCNYGSSGIYRSTDGGRSFTQVDPSGGAGQVLRTRDGALVWGGTGGGGMVRSTDDGATWSPVPTPVGAREVPPVELPDGRIAALQDGIVVTGDLGKTWTMVTKRPSIDPVSGFVYSKDQKAFFAWTFTCTQGPVPSNVIVRYDWDYEQ